MCKKFVLNGITIQWRAAPHWAHLTTSYKIIEPISGIDLSKNINNVNGRTRQYPTSSILLHDWEVHLAVLI